VKYRDISVKESYQRNENGVKIYQRRKMKNNGSLVKSSLKRKLASK
jgi:hypothetical protein